MQKRKKVPVVPHINRAVFIVNHPFLGEVAICRSVFERKAFGFSLQPLDECRAKASLHDVAQKAIVKIFPNRPVILRRRLRFEHRGLCLKMIKTTVFLLESPKPCTFSLLKESQYVPMENHPLHRHIYPAMSQTEPTRARVGMG